MAITAYIAWLIVKIALFVLFLTMALNFYGSYIPDCVKTSKVTKAFLWLCKVTIEITFTLAPFCLAFLLGVWLFAPEYLP